MGQTRRQRAKTAAKRRVGAVVAPLVVILAMGATPAWADDELEYYVPELRTAGRKLVGAGAGVGVFDGLCPGCISRGAVALEFYAGWQLQPRVAVILDVWSTVHFLPADGDNPGIAGYSAITVAAQTWITPVLFTRVGLGFGSATVISKVANTFEPGPAVSVSVGGELGHRKRSGIDLSLRFSGGPVDSDAILDSVFYSFAAMISYHRN